MGVFTDIKNYFGLGGKGQAPRLPRFHHVTVEVAPSEVQQCVMFYADVLGFRSVPSSVRNSMWFEEGIHLYWGMRSQPYEGPILAAHFAIVVGQRYEMIVAECKRREAFIVEGSKYWGSKRCYIQDPAGNRIELMEYPPDGPA